MTVHDPRHTAAFLAVKVGAKVRAVQRILCRSSAAMTLHTYAEPFDDDLNAVADRFSDAVTFSGLVRPLPTGTRELRQISCISVFARNSGGYSSAETEGFEPSVP